MDSVLKVKVDRLRQLIEGKSTKQLALEDYQEREIKRMTDTPITDQCTHLWTLSGRVKASDSYKLRCVQCNENIVVTKPTFLDLQEKGRVLWIGGHIQ